MSVKVKIIRSGQAIRDALEQVSPSEAAEFECEYRQALTRAAESLDLSEAELVLNRWWGVAQLRLDPPSAHERQLIKQFKDGNDVGWSSPADWAAAQNG